MIELMVALGIASILMVSALGAVRNLSRAEFAAHRRYGESSLSSELRDLLVGDIVHATQYDTTADGFSLRTYASLDTETMERAHLQATVEYEVRPIAEGSWLVRIQRGDERDNDLTELVCSGVSGVELTEPDTLTAEAEATEDEPAALTVTIEFEDVDRETVRYTVLRR